MKFLNRKDTKKMDELLNWMQDMYADLCDGDWEHENGFKIDNIDNPGWSFEFDVKDLDVGEIPMDPIDFKRSEIDWFDCEIKNGVFIGYGGAKNLIDIIREFKKWYLNAANICDARYDK